MKTAIVFDLDANQVFHPSGMTWEQWNWPFKTAEERRLVTKYFQEIEKENRNGAGIPDAPF